MDNLENELLDPTKENISKINFGNIKNLRQSRQAKIPSSLYSSQIIYGFTLISRKLVNNTPQPNLNPNIIEIPSSLAQFINTHIAQSQIHMVSTLRMLEFNVDNEGDDKPNS